MKRENGNNGCRWDEELKAGCCTRLVVFVMRRKEREGKYVRRGRKI